MTGLSKKLQQMGLRVSGIHPSSPGARVVSDDEIVLRWNSLRNVELALKTTFRTLNLRRDFDVIHCQHTHLQSAAACLVARILGRPSVLTLHGKVPRPPGGVRRAVQIATDWASLRLASALVAVSTQVAESYPSSAALVIENGVDTDVFRPSAAERRQIRERLGVSGEIVLIYVGRWSKTKGIEILLRAASSRRLADKHFRLVIIGEPAAGEPDMLLATSGIRNNHRIQILGAVHDELAAYLNAGDLFVLPSFYEGMPLSLLEALSCGLPVLASDIPVHRGLIERAGCGWTFQTGDSEDLARVFLKAIEEGVPPGWRQRAREAALKYHSAERMVSKYTALYRSLLRNAPGPRIQPWNRR